VSADIPQFNQLTDKQQELTPKAIVKLLDKYIVGQLAAKKAVAVALRNRIRRQRLTDPLRKEVIPKNILMIGPTGVGKTEIARRLANLSGSPFIKVEATKFTEVGYVGRSVDSMVRELVESAINFLKKEEMKKIEVLAEKEVEKIIISAILKIPQKQPEKKLGDFFNRFVEVKGQPGQTENGSQKTEPFVSEAEAVSNMEIAERYRNKELDDQFVDIEIEKTQSPPLGVMGIGGDMSDFEIDLQGFLGNLMPSKKIKKRMTVEQARKLLLPIESEKLIDMDKIISDALELAQNDGIIFIDELDKIASTTKSSSGPDVSREGVQRDLLPIIDGTAVTTKYGIVRTDHILFIAAGAFHISKPSDLIPEIQGRFPIRVELEPLTERDFERILLEPESSLIKQYKALLFSDGVDLVFDDSGIHEIAHLSFQLNEKLENIGARRLYTVLEKVLESVSFEAPDIEDTYVLIDGKYVKSVMNDIITDQDLSSYIL
jgi:ATP-dependent HslUV protease ATP-binding subunit HslU